MPSSKRKDSQNNIPLPKRFKEDHSQNGEFQVVGAVLTLSVPPVFAANPRAGTEEMLDSMIMRYIPSLQGVVLSHSNLIFVNKKAIIQRDCPFLICKVAFDATVWSPRVGLKLSGKINLSSPDHISLLVHRTFNISIPRHHIITDTWEFEYGPAENDPEFGAVTNEDDDEDDAITDAEADKERESGGKWVHKVTGEALGGKTGILEFTVIGLTVANEMLSLLGSLQPDPFSPRHTVHLEPQNGKQSSESEDSGNDSAEGSGTDSELGKDSEDDVDTLQTLGRRKDKKDKSVKQ